MMMRGPKRKVTANAVKSWMVVTETDGSRIQDFDKQSIMRRTGLPARDLRILDPILSNPSTILGRDRAIVVNLEHIQAIITSNEVLMVNSTNPFFLRFVQILHARVPPNTSFETQPRISSNDVVVVDGDSEEKPLLDEGSPSIQSPIDDSLNNNNVIEPIFVDNNNVAAPKQIPFEFKALEACIESACGCLESETQRLEEEAYPALDELTSQISTLNLERVRQIKNRFVALSGRVQKVADQLEHLLDDDNDMAEMYLTQKLEARMFDQTSVKEGNSSASDEDIDESHESYLVKDKSSDPKPDVEELEMLLEAYFAQINGVLQKLSSLSEYVDDTEDYINIMLDDKQNQLLQASIIFNTINMIMNAAIVVTGVFGMNIHIELFNGTNGQFWSTTCGTVLGCIILFLAFAWWGKDRFLLSE